MLIDTATGKATTEDRSSERVKKIFSEIAGKYERFNAVSSLGASTRWTNEMVAMTPATRESKVLDIAGGTGAITFALAKAKHPAHIQCTDLVPEMLEVAKDHYKNGESDGVPVSFEVVDAQNIPYDDESFDVVTMAYGIRNIPNRPKALEEIRRVLKPGGSLVCLEFSTPPNPVWRSVYSFYRDHFIPFWGDLLTKKREGFEYLSQSIQAFPNYLAFAGMLRNAKYSHVTWKKLTGGIAAVHVAQK